MKTVPFLTVLVAAVLCLTLAGCGGGSKASGLNGVANIHAYSEKPMVALVWLNTSNNQLVTDTSCSLERSSSSWQDKAFRVPWPSSSIGLWGVAAYNDTNGDGRYADSEILGYSTSFLRKSGSKFVLVNSSGYVYNSDATTATGKDVYINCTYSRSEPLLTEAEMLKLYKALQTNTQ